MYERVRRQSLSSSVFEQLRERILTGALPVGEALPAERVLCEHLGVNRNAVREGLKRLEQAGLVAIRQGGVSRVLDFSRTAGLDILASMVVSPTGEVRTGVARSIVEMRSALAPDLGRLCAARAGEATLRELDALVLRMRAAPEDLPALQALALDFWAAVVAGTENLAFQLAFNSLATTYRQIGAQLLHVMRAEVSAVDEYAALVTAIRAKNERLAARRAAGIVRHGADAIAVVLQALDAARGARP